MLERMPFLPTAKSDGVLAAIGATPLVQLTRIFSEADFRLYAKLECFNPGGSIKDRAAVNMIRRAIENNNIKPGTTVVESSSGNLGVGLAMACAYFDLPFICVVDPKITTQNMALIRAYGATIDMVIEPDPESGEFLQARLNRVQELLREIPNSYWPNQYANLNNPNAHHETMKEILAQVGERIDYIFCATSTCGTISGCSEYLRQFQSKSLSGQRTRIIAVDAVGSVIFGGQKAKRLIPGHGASVVPKLCRPELVDRCVRVRDIDCVIGCRLLVKHEALMTGGSSGGILMAINATRDDIPSGAVCVAIFPDHGQRYLDTIYSDAWVEKHFAKVNIKELEWKLGMSEYQ